MATHRIRLIALTTILAVTAFFAKSITAQAADPQSTLLNVVVAPKSGVPATGLKESDFMLSDNGSPVKLSSVREVSGTQEPIKVILVIDAVNSNFDRVAYAREGVQKFLKLSEGHLAQQTALAVLTDKGVEMEKSFSADGNVLSASLDNHTIGLREITRSSGIYGADERVQLSLRAVQQLSAYAATLPGRKLILWISPGWPLLSGARIDLSSKQHQQIFANVVQFSRQMQKANITLYNVNPSGPDESLFRADYYRTFINGVSNAQETDLADLSLQVLAVQSGGLALNSNDVAGNISQCLLDTKWWYELNLDVPQGDRASEYHHLEIKVDKPGLIVRTRDGYYARP